MLILQSTKVWLQVFNCLLGSRFLLFFTFSNWFKLSLERSLYSMLFLLNQFELLLCNLACGSQLLQFILCFKNFVLIERFLILMLWPSFAQIFFQVCHLFSQLSVIISQLFLISAQDWFKTFDQKSFTCGLYHVFLLIVDYCSCLLAIESF